MIIGKARGIPALKQPPAKGTRTTSAPLTATFTENTTSGTSLIIAVCSAISTLGALNPVSGITLSSGSGSFSKVISAPGQIGSYPSVEIWIAPNIVGGVTPQLTVIFTNPAVTSAYVVAFEVADLSATVDLDGTPLVAAGGTALTVYTSLAGLNTLGPETFVVSAFSSWLSTPFISGSANYTIVSASNYGSLLAQYQNFSGPQTGLRTSASQGIGGYYSTNTAIAGFR